MMMRLRMLFPTLRHIEFSNELIPFGHVFAESRHHYHVCLLACGDAAKPWDRGCRLTAYRLDSISSWKICDDELAPFQITQLDQRILLRHHRVLSPIVW